MRKRFSASWLIIGGLLSVLGFGAVWSSLALPTDAMQPAVVLSLDFETPPEGWLSLDDQAQIRWATDKDAAKSGKGALEYRYTLRQGAFPALLREVSIPQAKSFRFFAKATAATVLVMTVQEQDESRYNAAFFCPKGKWQEVVLSVDDFTLADDAYDENGKLDVEQVSTIGFLDIAASLAQSASIPDPERSLFLDDFQVFSTPTPTRRRLTETDGQRDVTVDTFDTLAHAWIPVTMGEKGFGLDDTAALEVVTDKTKAKVGEGSLRYNFTIQPKVIPAAIAFTTIPSDVRSVRFWVKSGTATFIVFGMDEKDGSRYQVGFYVPADAWQEVRVNLDEFHLADDSKDENGRLDPAQVQTIGVVDISAILVNLVPELKGTRTLWLDEVTFSTRAEPRTFGEFQQDGKTVLVVDSFETDLVRWTAATIFFNPFAISLTPDGVFGTTGDDCAKTVEPTGSQSARSLKVTYQRPQMGVFLLVRGLGRTDLSRADRLVLHLKSAKQGMFIVQLKERDDSEYVTQVPIDSDGAGWQRVEVALRDFVLGENSSDENNKLDADQIKELKVLDVTGLLQAGGENTLWLDSVAFVLR